MKKLTFLLVMLAIGIGTTAAAEKEQAGPNGGRLLKTDPRAEFFVNDERKIEIRFLDSELKPIDPGERSVRVTAMTPSGRTVIEFEEQEGEGDSKLVSKEPVPEGEGYTMVVQVFEKPDARPQNFRIVYEEHVCGGCDLAEYACICGH